MAALSDGGKKQSSSTQIDASTIHAIFVIRLKGPRLSGSNPIDGLSSQPLNYVHNSTSPTTIKERSTIPARMSCYLECHVNGCGLSLELHWKKVVDVASNYAAALQENGECSNSSPLFNQTTRQGEKRNEKASSSLYLDELLIQKCKFRHRFTVKS